MAAYNPQDPASFTGWLTTFEAAARAHRGRFGLDDATLAHIAGVKAGVDGALDAARRAEGAALAAREDAALAQREVAEAERRLRAAHEALQAEIEARERLFQGAAGWLQPMVELVNERRNAPRRDLAALSAPSISGGHPSISGGHPMSASVSGRAMTMSISGVRPIAPQNLVVTAQQRGVNVLRWTPQGNEPGTSYAIEAAIGSMYRGSAAEPEASSYKVVATVASGAAYSHALRVSPGVRVSYRVRAIGHHAASAYSNEVTVTCL
ncbi:hypothetical protein [Sorangium sp. So ce1024]|uniref:hypothetical protein n=1 Tax=Sorangium sp. So ce1024 TaxID=3133327 RepID=UPI003F0D05EC